MAPSELERAFRDDRVTVVASVLRRTGDLQLAEDATQEAFAAAVEAWARDGVPTSPRAWLITAAWRRAIDRIRSDRADDRRSDQHRRVLADRDTGVEESDADDDVFVLIGACCHPALAETDRVALTLRSVLGLSTSQVADLFLVGESAMARRLVRAKRRIRDAGISLRRAEGPELAERLTSIRDVAYTLFTSAVVRPSGAIAVDFDVAAEAIWLARLIHRLDPGGVESAGLLALMLSTHARSEGRVDQAGNLVTLELQDRARWNRDLIAEAVQVLISSRRLGMPGRLWLEAAVSVEHSLTVDGGDPDWTHIVALYEQLHELSGDPIVACNRAVAMVRAGRAKEAWACLEVSEVRRRLEGAAVFHAARAETAEALDRTDVALGEWRRCLDALDHPPSIAVVAGRIDRLQRPATQEDST